jgi:hypothetical protein
MGLGVFHTALSAYLVCVLVSHLANVPGMDTTTGIQINTNSTSPLSRKAQLTRMANPSGLAYPMPRHQMVIHSASVILSLSKMLAQVRDGSNLNGTRNVASHMRGVPPVAQRLPWLRSLR